MWSSNDSTEVAFLPIYLVLGCVAAASAVRHGLRGALGHISLVIFCVVRFVGNLLLLIAAHTSGDVKGLVIAGFIMQGLGYSFLITAMLSYLSHLIRDMDRAEAEPAEKEAGGKRTRIERILNVVNIVALVLLIVGFNESMGSISTSSGALNMQDLNVMVKVGNILYLALTVLLAAIAFMHIPRVSTSRQKLLLYTMISALPFMVVRCVYTVYVTFQGNPRHGSLAARIVCQYVMEVIVLIVLGVSGLLLPRQGAPHANPL